MKFTIVGSAMYAGFISHYGFATSFDWALYRPDVPMTANVAMWLASFLIAVGFMKE